MIRPRRGTSLPRVTGVRLSHSSRCWSPSAQLRRPRRQPTCTSKSSSPVLDFAARFVTSASSRSSTSSSRIAVVERLLSARRQLLRTILYYNFFILFFLTRFRNFSIVFSFLSLPWKQFKTIKHYTTITNSMTDSYYLHIRVCTPMYKYILSHHMYKYNILPRSMS